MLYYSGVNSEDQNAAEMQTGSTALRPLVLAEISNTILGIIQEATRITF